MTKAEMRRFAQELLAKHMGYKVSQNAIVPLEYSTINGMFDYLLFRLSTNENIIYAYRNDIVCFGESLILYPNPECVNGVYIYEERKVR